MVNIVHGTTKKPVSSNRLADFFINSPQYDGYLYIGYPIIGTAEGPYPIDALWVSKEKGLVVFNLIEGRDLGEFKETQDDSANKLDAKLRSNKSLMKGRSLEVPISVITFAPARADVTVHDDDNYKLCNENNLLETLDKFSWDGPEPRVKILGVNFHGRLNQAA